MVTPPVVVWYIKVSMVTPAVILQYINGESQPFFLPLVLLNFRVVGGWSVCRGDRLLWSVYMYSSCIIRSF